MSQVDDNLQLDLSNVKNNNIYNTSQQMFSWHCSLFCT